MKLSTTPPQSTPVELTRLLRTIAQQVNAITEGQQHAFHSSLTSTPTFGSWAQGDFVLNATPSELGTVGAKYIVHGWRCVTSGTPGTWVQVRTLTGA